MTDTLTALVPEGSQVDPTLVAIAKDLGEWILGGGSIGVVKTKRKSTGEDIHMLCVIESDDDSVKTFPVALLVDASFIDDLETPKDATRREADGSLAP